MRYELQIETPNTYVRHELRKNRGNLPMRWKGIALSDDVEALTRIMPKGARIEDRDTGEVFNRR